MDSSELQNAIIAVNAGGGTIDFKEDIDLTAAFGAPNLRPLNVATNFSPVAFLITINEVDVSFGWVF